jgi:2-amino-4-hydroxy-6-hydroxymethyldihydropteridine diphosphokinase
METVYLGLGTNLGDREANLRGALERLSAHLEIDGVSRVYVSEPVGWRDQPEFWNLVVCGRTALPPAELLAACARIQEEAGARPAFRNGPRALDIDILLVGGRRIAGPALEVPHPRMLERAFVLRPLAELAPGLRHPTTGRTIAEHLASAGPLERAEPLFDGRDLLPAAPGGAEAGR